MYIINIQYVTKFGTNCDNSLSNVKLKNQNKMKTKINISNLKKIGITIAAGLVLTTATFAGSIPASKEERVSANMLDAMMTQPNNPYGLSLRQLKNRKKFIMLLKH